MPSPSPPTATYGMRGSDYNRRAVSTADGQFTLKGLPNDKTLLHVFFNNEGPLLSGQLETSLTYLSRDVPTNAAGIYRPERLKEAWTPVPEPIVVTLHELKPPIDHIHHLLGMTVADLDLALLDENLLAANKGVVVLDVGPNAARLGFDDMKVGDRLWKVGPVKFEDTTDLIKRLIQGCEAWGGKTRDGVYPVEMVWDRDRPNGGFSDQAWIGLTPKDLAELRKLDKPQRMSPEPVRSDDDQ